MDVDTNKPLSVEEIKLMKRDVLLKVTNKNEFSGTDIYIPEKKEDELKFYDVIKISNSVSLVSTGEVVACFWARTMPPFPIGTDYYTITSEDEIVAVLEED